MCTLQNTMGFFEVPQYTRDGTDSLNTYVYMHVQVLTDSLRYFGMGQITLIHAHAWVPYRIPWGSLRYHSTLGMG